MVNGGGEASVNVAVVQLAVQDQKVGVTVDEGSDCVRLRPRRLLKEFLGQSIEPVRWQSADPLSLERYYYY